MSSPTRPEPALERRIVSVLFADLVGFTPFAERLDAEDVATVQDAYFAAVRETVGRYGGRLEKFIGDAAMAVFGIPRARDDDAERAVRAALALTSAVEQVGARFGLDEPGFQVRVGVNTGEVVIGGSEALATGDTVNVASRFQSAAGAGTVVVGEATALSIEDAIELEPLEPLELKGKTNRVAAWRATAFAADMAEGAEATAAALEIYRGLGDAPRTAWAAHALGMIELQQLRFQDSFDLANVLLEELDEAAEAQVAVLYALRAAASYALTNDLSRSEPDTRVALAAAREVGDERLELAALEWSVAFHSPEPAHLESVDIDRTISLADQAGRWTTVTAAYESRALLLVMSDRADEATVAIEQLDEVASTHGVTEALAWSDYLRCEQGLLTGDWDAAVESGLRAIELADRNGYARAGIRTWMALGALAHARDDRLVLDQLHAWHETRRPLLSRVPSPFARLMFEALVVRLVDAGIPLERLIDQPPLPQTFAVPFRQPAWFAGADAVFISLVDEGELADAEAALAFLTARNREWSSSMSLGFEDLLRARLAAAQAAAFEADGERALERFRSIAAPWWEAKVLRLLGRGAEAKPIEERLGLAREAR